MSCTGIKICELNIPTKILSVNKTTRLVNMALEMMNFVDNFTTSKGKKLKLKIGIHQGDVIAGVIGEHKPQFSLIGDTVNTTSRVCSTGESGEITLSEEAVKDLNIYSFHLMMKTVEAKGKGTLKVYQIKKRNTKAAARFQRITELILKKIKEEKKEKPFQIESKKNSLLKVVNLLKSVRSFSTGSDINLNKTSNKIIPNNNSNDIKNEGSQDTKNEKKVITKENRNFNKPLKNLLNLESQYGEKLKFSAKIVPKGQKTLEKQKTLKNPINTNKYQKKKTVLSLKHKIQNPIIVLKGVEQFLHEKKLYFFNWGKKRHLEFVKQLVQKHAFTEKMLLFTLFFFSLIRIFLLLTLSDFFENNSFVVMEIVFMLLLGLILLFVREFYHIIAKKPVLKYLLFVLFLIAQVASLTEFYFSIIHENYSTLLMNFVILHLVFTNIW